MTTEGGASGSRKRVKAGGRKPGTWTLLQPEELLAFREQHRISRHVLSKALGVSGTTIQNWETGRHVATHELQAKLVALMAAGRDAVEAAGSGPGARDPARALARLAGDQLTATGTIVAGYLATRSQGMTQEELVDLVRQVRAALSGHD